MRWAGITLWLGVAWGGATQEGAEGGPATAMSEELVLLGRIRYHMAQTLERLPNYTCVQTIERSQRRARARRFELVDTLRLEVALVEGKELYAWPGARNFEERELREWVGGGTIGNGNFALHARAVFLGRSATFTYEGLGEVEGRKVHRFRYRVPRFMSGYRLRSGDIQDVVGYSGVFEADAETLDLRLLVVTAEEIPPSLPIKSASDRMEYARVRIGESDFLLPRSSELILTDLDGMESRNRVQFSGCRHYTGESVISFADPPPETAPAVTAPARIELPDGLLLDVRLEKAIRFGETAIGDEVRGKLGADAKRRGKTIVPREAKVRGRITSLERRQARVPVVVVGIELDEIEFAGATVELEAELEEVTLIPSPSARTGIDKRGMIYISGTRPDLPKGVRTVWRVRNPTDRQEP